MSFLSLLFSVRGRINRLQYWLGTFAVYGASWAAMLLGGLLSIAAVPRDAGKEGAFGVLISLMLLAIPIFGTAFWCYTALQIKRFHDRGKSWLFVLLPFALATPVFAMPLAGAAVGAPTIGAGMTQPFIWLLLAISVWYFVELGCLPSAKGPNKYGDPPGGGLGAGAPQAPAQPNAPVARPAAALGGAELAIERAIAAQKLSAAASASAIPPRRAPAGSGAPGFGRRVAR